MEFRCANCNTIFESEPTIKNYHHPLYGECSKNVADCPQCNREASEKVQDRKGKEKAATPPCGNSSGCNACMQ